MENGGIGIVFFRDYFFFRIVECPRTAVLYPILQPPTSGTQNQASHSKLLTLVKLLLFQIHCPASKLAKFLVHDSQISITSKCCSTVYFMKNQSPV